MKRVKLIVLERSINKHVGKKFDLFLYDGATLLYAIKKVDGIIKRRAGKFPVEEYESLLHMTYNPVKKKFYEQVKISANTPTCGFLNARNDLQLKLPDETTVRLVLLAACGDAPEEIIDYQEFQEAILKDPVLKSILK
jgi:hypothetical protein